MLIALLLLGCTGEPGDSAAPEGESGEPPGGCGEPAVVIGTGEQTWVSLAEGDPVTMVHGPQGGWHMLGSARVTGTDDIVSIHYTVTHVETGAVVADNTYRVALVLDGECGGYYPGMYAYLNVAELAEGEADTPPELLSYDPVVMRMEIEDGAGLTASASLQVTAEPDPMDVKEGYVP